MRTVWYLECLRGRRGHTLSLVLVALETLGSLGERMGGRG